MSCVGCGPRLWQPQLPLSRLALSKRGAKARTGCRAQDTSTSEARGTADAEPRSEASHLNGTGVPSLKQEVPSYWQQVAHEVDDPETLKVVSIEFMAQVCAPVLARVVACARAQQGRHCSIRTDTARAVRHVTGREWPCNVCLARKSTDMATQHRIHMQALFNFTSCSIVSTAKMWAGDTAALVPLQATIGHFVLLFVLVQATQPTSGGHFNPMVSAVMAYWGELRASRLPWYIVAQMLGGVLGSMLQYRLLPVDMRDVAHAAVQVRPAQCLHCTACGDAAAFNTTPGCTVHVAVCETDRAASFNARARTSMCCTSADSLALCFVQAIPDNHTVLQGFMAEFAAAFVLIFLVCATALDKKGHPDRIPLVMALTIPLLLYTVAPVSSMCINPARAFGPAVAANFWTDHWVWWTAPFLGAFAAVVPYKYLSDREASESKS